MSETLGWVVIVSVGAVCWAAGWCVARACDTAESMQVRQHDHERVMRRDKRQGE